MKLKEFDPRVLPVRLWVCTDPDADNLASNFIMFEMDDTFPTNERNKELFKGLPEDSDFANCTKVVNNSGIRGCLLTFGENCTITHFVHECSHFVDWCDEYLGLESHDFEHGEIRAYLIEWAFNCCCEFYDKDEEKN